MWKIWIINVSQLSELINTISHLYVNVLISYAHFVQQHQHHQTQTVILLIFVDGQLVRESSNVAVATKGA